MARSSGLLPRLWRAFRPVSRSSAPCAVACPDCGHTWHGQRGARHQVVSCPRCQHPIFILPRSPLFPGAARDEAPRGAIGPRSFWLMPALAGSATLLVLLLIILTVLPYLSRRDASWTEPSGKIETRIEAGRTALAEGGFHQAAVDLGQVCKQLREQPGLLSSARQRQVEQWYRQADLLDRLLSQSLQELLDKAQAVGREDEWQVRFRNDYQGKTVVFDDLLRRDAEGRPVLSFTSVRSGEVSARLALEEVRLLARLPLVQPQRVLFGAQLAGLAREAGGHWVIHFEPDSGVLLTDQDAFRACAPILLDRDPSIAKVLERQKDWLEQLPPREK